MHATRRHQDLPNPLARVAMSPWVVIGVSLASVMGPGCCHEEGTTLGHE